MSHLNKENENENETENEMDTSPLLQQDAVGLSYPVSVPTAHQSFVNTEMVEMRPVQPASVLDQSTFRIPPDRPRRSSSLSSSQDLVGGGDAAAQPQSLSPPRLAVQGSPRLEDRRLVPRLSQRLSMRRPLAVSLPTKRDLGHTNSILSAASPSNIRSHIWPSKSKNRRPSNSQELQNLKEEDLITVDISFLEGPGSNAVPSHKRAESSSLYDVEPDVLPKSDELLDAPTPNIPGVVIEERVEQTVRTYGQQLADQNNVIVSVKESAPAVDLSSLEGSERRQLSKAETTTSYNGAGGVDETSFFYPTDPEKPNWKPFSMAPSYLIMLAIVSLGLAGVQEYLYQRSSSLESKGKGLIQFDNVSDIPTSEFFAWKYLPTMVMVTYGVLWQITEYNVKRLEPYYQLSRPAGNVASKSLNLDYTTLFSYFVPYKSIRNGHWTVVVASIGTILATTAAPSLQNASITPIDNPSCYPSECNSLGLNLHIVRIVSVWSRLVSVCLILVAIMALALLLQLRRKSGLLSDPKGIAGIASMATKSHILNDFQGMDTATDNDIHKKLRHRRYVLYKSSIWQGEYIKYTEDLSSQYEQQENRQKKQTSPHPIALHKGPGIAFLVYLTFLVAFIPVLTYTNANVVAEKLPWLPVLLAVIARQMWTTLESTVKLLEPFYALSQGNARPENTLILDYQGTPYGLLPFQAILDKHYLVSLMGIGSILSDVLTVTSASLSLRDETEKSFMASSALSTVIVFFLLCSAILSLLCRRHYFVPRPPSTIASILAFIHQSHMLDDFVNTERFSSDQMRSMLVAKNKRYGLGWFRGRDGKLHCGVDQEPMLSKYVHGVSYKDAQAAPWEESLGF
jgi:Protein of unknown function (DUF3433)